MVDVAENAQQPEPIIVKAPNGGTAETPPPLQEHAESVKPIRVATIEGGAVDGRKRPIERVFYKFDEYAIYQTGEEIAVQYSDKPEVKKTQIEQLADLIQLRRRLQYLVNGTILNSRYLPEIADAFFLALQGKMDIGKQVLDDAIKDINDVRTRAGRVVYLKFAVALAMGAAAILFILGQHAFHKAQVVPLWATAGAGAIGALLSIAIALRGRTVATDGDWRTNGVDVTIRILIGVISAAALYLILSSGIMTSLQVNDLKITGPGTSWQIALVIGFAAGFLERLVPDLLEKKK